MQSSRPIPVFCTPGAFGLASLQRLLPSSLTLGFVLAGVFMGSACKSDPPKPEPIITTS